MWRCPTCNSKDHLNISVEVWAKLIQPDSEPEAFETDLDEAESHDHEWSANSVMMCVNPDCADSNDTHIAEYFEVEDEDEDDAEEDDTAGTESA
jgi:hypothetical protein